MLRAAPPQIGVQVIQLHQHRQRNTGCYTSEPVRYDLFLIREHPEGPAELPGKDPGPAAQQTHHLFRVFAAVGGVHLRFEALHLPPVQVIGPPL